MARLKIEIDIPNMSVDDLKQLVILTDASLSEGEEPIAPERVRAEHILELIYSADENEFYGEYHVLDWSLED